MAGVTVWDRTGIRGTLQKFGEHPALPGEGGRGFMYTAGRRPGGATVRGADSQGRSDDQIGFGTVSGLALRLGRRESLSAEELDMNHSSHDINIVTLFALSRLGLSKALLQSGDEDNERPSRRRRGWTHCTRTGRSERLGAGTSNRPVAVML